jgi:hypothetical protein
MSAQVITFNLITYLSRPQNDVPTAVALTYALKASHPTSLGDAARGALRVVEQRGGALEEGWKAQQAQPAESNGPARLALVNVWSFTVTRVEQYTHLPSDLYPTQPAAVRIYALLAPDGLAIARATGRQLWTTAKARLDLVRERGLYNDLRRIAGKDFVAEVTRCHKNLGRALRITEAPAVATPVNLLELLRDHTQAVTDYVVQVAATVQRDDPATIKAALDALKPLDDAREAMGRRAGTAQPEKPETTEEPAPPEKPAQPVVTPVTQPVATPVAQPAQPTPPEQPNQPAPATPAVVRSPTTRPSLPPPPN